MPQVRHGPLVTPMRASSLGWKRLAMDTGCLEMAQGVRRCIRFISKVRHRNLDVASTSQYCKDLGWMFSFHNTQCLLALNVAMP